MARTLPDAEFIEKASGIKSRFVMDARSSVGASGLMQVMPATAKWTARKIGLDGFTVDQLHLSGGQTDPDAHVVRPTSAQVGRVIAWTLKEDVDLSRGDVLVEVDDPTPLVSRHLLASVCWLDREPLSIARKNILCF